jgi:hypothetical protein
VKKTEVLGISRDPFPVHFMLCQKLLENMAYYGYFSGMIINNGRCRCKIISRITIAKATFNKNKTLFISKIGNKLKQGINKVLHLVRSILW